MTDSSKQPVAAPDFARAGKDAVIAGIIALGIFGSLVGLKTEQNMDNQLIVENRWLSAFVIVAIVMVGRFVLQAFVYPRLAAGKLDRARPGLGETARRALPIFLIVLATTFVLYALIYEIPGAIERLPTVLGFAVLVTAILEAAIRWMGRPAAPMDEAAILAKAARKKRVSRGGLVFLFLYPAIVLALFGIQGSIKWVDNFGVQILIYVMLGWGLNIVIGLAGLLDLGYVAFYAVGAYSYTLLATTFGLSFWVLLPVAGILAALWGVILGFPVLRLRGDYLAIVTLAFGEIIRLVLINWKDFSGGSAGISSIPKVTLFGIPFDASPGGFAKMFDLPISSAYYKIFLYYLILLLALLTAYVTLRLRRLPIGRAWEALREDEVACRSLGINTTNTKLTAFATGAMFAGFAGSFFAARQGFVSPESFVFMESAVIVAIVVLGGMGSMIGVAVAAAVMIGGTELLRELAFLKAVFGQDFNPDQFRMLLFGLAMVVIMVWKPRGFVSAREPTAFLFERKTISGDLVKEGHG
ncbi:high-affinity branched-chain amino acid ABC transporter permease LivM [Oharaeibacter diazotrophicus]|uniref:General L-amino acid ABC transporter membrane protein n=1 Tax=Oharaeibacter diazotrophicus TaxID=1920512 RepID=A0A4R6RN21_9HYPH|nr:high-affinity branched-chain amino acid ABC transporter permease LivM [Oharaeibacter diazotrophicus]TDP87585.1 general L-amino acid ABC transporter membrane protein [Oharaeibacter diazotrophicus]BBE70471.1 leucine/isoleucine/valine transporter permease subunit [Pleomorphomonas sp. SM30]GLS77215.1 branched-chain amino acid ABC transporter permease [Oharaeibacter diazotrophicus]